MTNATSRAHLLGRVVAGQEQGDREDRSELADRTRGDGEDPERVGRMPVTQDREQGAVRGGGEHQADEEARAREPDHDEEPADGEPEDERDHPALDPTPGRLAAPDVEVDLEAGDEEQHRDAELREPVDEGRDLGPGEDLAGRWRCRAGARRGRPGSAAS